MSSEAFSGGSEIAPVIPLNRKVVSAEQSADIIDFSTASTDIVVEMLFTSLRHPKSYTMKSDQLARFIINEFKEDKDAAPTSLQARLAKLTQTNAFNDDEMYDRKVEQDPVFQVLVDRLHTTRNDKDLAEQRRAARDLLGLRAAVPDDTTGADKEWLWLVERLFNATPDRPE